MTINPDVADQLAITDLLYRYARAIDSVDAEALTDTWLPGAVSEEAIAYGIAFHGEYVKTFHNVTNHVHTIEGDTAVGWTYCVCTFIRDDGGQLMKFDIYFQYDNERFVKKDGRWYIAQRNIASVYSTKPVPVSDGFPDDFGYDWSTADSNAGPAAR